MNLAGSRVKDRRRVDDHYSQRARQENYPARSVYKLKEIDEKHGLLVSGARVLDLGCAPGSWTIYAARRVGPEGRVIGVDRRRVEGRWAANIRILQADVTELDLEACGIDRPFDLVMSDMAPNTTGRKDVDQARSAELARAAWDLARQVLRPGGAFLVKVFQGPEAEELFQELKSGFKVFRRIKPKSSRSFSFEIFGLGLYFMERKASGGPEPVV